MSLPPSERPDRNGFSAGNGDLLPIFGEASLTGVVGVGIAGQLVHAAFQIVVAGTLAGVPWIVVASTGFLAAVAGGVVTVRHVRTIRTDWRAKREHLVEATQGAKERADRLQDDLSGLREGVGTPQAPEPHASPDGGVAAADGHSPTEFDDHLLSYAEIVDAAGEGDLTQRLDETAPSDGLEVLAGEFNEMVEAFEQTIDAASDFSADLADSSEQITAATEAVQDASDSVTVSVQEIADVFHEQHEQISQISDEMEEMSATIQEIAASSNEVTEMADKTEQRTIEGIESGREARDAMAETMERTESVVDTVEVLNEQMNEVGQIVDLIDDIAEQTNILALNASIEAAHAASNGTDGDGFTVVADEVKTLAGETKEATDKIERLIGDIQDQTDDTVEEIREMRESVEKGHETVGEGLDSLESIQEHVERTTSGVRDISESTDEQAGTSQEVASIADEAATTSQENVEEAERVASIAEEQNLALSEMYVNVKMLSMRARQLSTLFDQYDTGEE